jgi:hypothetical protein
MPDEYQKEKYFVFLQADTLFAPQHVFKKHYQ